MPEEHQEPYRVRAVGPWGSHEGRGHDLVAALDSVRRELDSEGWLLAINAVYRATNEPLFRSDNRDPSVIFQEGFAPKNTHNADLDNYVLTNQPAIYVSTSTSAPLAFSWGAKYVYDIRTPTGGIDVNTTYGSHSPYPDQEEVAFPGGVDPKYIKGAWTDHGYTSNPNYDPGPGVTEGDDPFSSQDLEMADAPDTPGARDPSLDMTDPDAPEFMDID
ncbi:enterotoxin A family protein [Streptomyces sp. NPDC058221]|uniref:scabin-related ADP-ribosyltransferase n=1 Tax=Streptomyces sp. NPDC058221 TaxID=3346388 RepID=UPI0036E7E64E